MGKYNSMLGVVIRVGSVWLNINVVKEILGELSKLFEVPIKDFVRVWQVEREKEGKLVSSDDLLTCYEICKEKCKPKIILRFKEMYKSTKLVEIISPEELNRIISPYLPTKINGLFISMRIENYSVEFDLTNNPFYFSTVSIHSCDEIWLNNAKEKLTKLLSKFKTYNYLFTNPITIAFLTCIITTIIFMSWLVNIKSKLLGVIIMIPYFVSFILLFLGLLFFGKRFLPLITWKISK